MTKNRKSKLSHFIIDLIMIGFSLFRVVPNFISLIEREVQLFKKSLVHLLILYLIAGTLLTTTWLCILAMFFLYFISLQLSPLLSMLIIAIINVLLLVISGLLISKNKNNLSFTDTRHLLKKIHLKP